jgi:hypothetical protein
MSLHGRFRPCFWARWYYRLNVLASALLCLVLGIGPWLDNGLPGAGWRRYLVLFARDPTVRRVALVCALGLAVTALTCFRPQAKLCRARRPAAGSDDPQSFLGA